MKINIFKSTLLIAISAFCFTPQSFAADVNKEDIANLEQKASQGSAEDQYKLGKLYETSHQYINQDYFKAVEWYTKAANQGLAQAQYSLGQLYEKSQGVPQDYTKAIEWYTKAANQGLVNAQYSLGQLYEKNHRDLPRDYTKAVEWYTKAANQKITLNKNNMNSYVIPRNSYYRLNDLLSSANFQKSQDVSKVKEFFKQDCLNKHQNSCDLYKKLND